MRTYSASSGEIESLLAMLDALHEVIAIEIDGQVRGVLVNPAKYERLRNALIELDWQMIQRVQERNADKDPDEILREVTRVVEEVRQERYERERASRDDER